MFLLLSVVYIIAGNWQYASGVGADPREDRYFNVVKQSTVYDPDCEFIKTWCPELRGLPHEYIHNPLTITEDIRTSYGLENREVLPDPIVVLKHSEYKLPGKSSKQLKKAQSHGGVPGLR